MKGKALAALREAWTALRWIVFSVYLVAYGFVWVIWGIGGLQLLRDLGVTTIPSLGFFVIASAMVMFVGFISFQRDLREFLRL